MGYYFRLAVNSNEFALKSRAERIKRRSRLSASDGRIVFGRKTLSAALVTLMVIAGFSYLTLVNIRAVKGFEIRKLEQKIADLEEVYKRLEQEAAQLQSIQRIEQQLGVSNFIPTTNVSYLTPSDYALSGEEGATP